MSRRDELINIIGSENETKAGQLVDEIIFIEDQLISLKKLPFIKVHPSDPSRQKTTPAARQYRELLQQYNACLRVLLKINGNDDKEEDSPLRKWLNARNDMDA